MIFIVHNYSYCRQPAQRWLFICIRIPVQRDKEPNFKKVNMQVLFWLWLISFLQFWQFFVTMNLVLLIILSVVISMTFGKASYGDPCEFTGDFVKDRDLCGGLGKFMACNWGNKCECEDMYAPAQPFVEYDLPAYLPAPDNLSCEPAFIRSNSSESNSTIV